MKKLILILATIMMSFQVMAEKTVADIEKEIAFLAKNLLELTGQNSYTITKEKTFQPMFGACFNINGQGIKLTCITPDLDPHKKGLLTGYIITKINDISFVNKDLQVSKKLFQKFITGMNPGDNLAVNYINHNQQNKSVVIVVAKVDYPGFKLTVSQ